MKTDQDVFFFSVFEVKNLCLTRIAPEIRQSDLLC